MQKNYVQEILSIIHSGLPKAELAEKLSDYHEKDLADALEALTPAERQSLYSILGVDTVAEIFTYLDDAEPYLKELPSHEAAKVISNMDSDDAVDALEDLDDTDKNEIVNKLDKDSVEDVKMLLSYDEDEIGSRMTTNYISIKNDMTIRQAMSELVKQAGENDNISTLYVVDGSGVFAHESTERSFSAVAALYEEAVQVVVRADSGITTLEELQGCTLSVGEEESGSEQNAWQVLAACGLNNRLVHTVNLNYTDAAARLADGTIDAMFVTAGLHADALEQLAETCAIRLLSVDGGVGARLLAAYPAYRACVIPAGTYAGQGEDVWTISVQALLLASNALSDETVQRLTARYFDSVDAVAAAVPVPLVTDPAVAAAQSVIPYHTGAAAYYTAQGITPAGPETGASPEQEAAA